MTENLTRLCKSVRPTSKDQKTWLFRKSTTARRALLMDDDIQEFNSMPVRRSSRRVRRTDKLLEFLSTSKRRRGVRQQTLVCLENCDSPYQTVANAEKTPEANFHGGHEEKTPEEPSAFAMTSERTADERRRPRCGPDSGNSGTDTEDSDELTLKELQDLLKKRKKGETKEATGPGSLLVASKLGSNRVEDKVEDPDSECHGVRHVPGAAAVEATLTEEGSPAKMGEKPSRQREQSEVEDDDMEEEESSQSDPNAVYCICRQKHNQRFMICCDRCEEWFHGDCVGVTEAQGRLLESNGEDYVCPSCRSRTIRTSDARVPSAGAKQELEGRALNSAFGMTALPKCIGPGCGENALPDSVYCSSDCIVRHAAEAIKSLRNVKEPRGRQKPSKQAQKTLEQGNTPKGHLGSVQQKTFCDRVTESFSKSEEKQEMSTNEEEWAELELSIPSWFSKHNDNTLNPDGAILSLSEEEHAEEIISEPSVSTQKQPIMASKSPEDGGKATIQGDALTRGIKRPHSPVNSVGASKIYTHPPGDYPVTTNWNLAAASDGTPRSQPSGLLAPHSHVSRVLSFSPTPYTLPKKKTHALSSGNQQLMHPQTPPTSVSSMERSPHSVSLDFPVQYTSLQSSAVRQNICQSFTEILIKRVSDSDNLEISESEIEKLAISIEKEMFNVFLHTDSRYRNKCSTLMLCLKDPKNVSLFYRVVKGEVTPFFLVRMTSEQLSLSIERPESKRGTAVLDPTHRVQLELPQQAANLNMDCEKPLLVAKNEECKELCCGASPDSPSTAGPATYAPCSVPKNLTSESRNKPSDHDSAIWPDLVVTKEEPTISKSSPSSAALKMELKVRRDSWPFGEENPSDRRSSDTQPACDRLSMLSASLKDTCNTVTSESSTITRDPGPSSGTSQDLGCTGLPASSTIITATELVTECRATQSSNIPTPRSHPRSTLLRPATLPDYFSTVDSSFSVADPLSPEDTAQFLVKQQVLWKGFINMHTVTKFVAKAYLVSGSFQYLEKNLPCSMQISGRISPNTVWDYVGRLKTTVWKDLCLVRFFPAMEEEEEAYSSLFSYFCSRERFGVVANKNPHIKDLYLIPLSAKEPIPSKLLPFHGPGLESSRPDLLLGLVICQTQKCTTVPLDSREKTSAIRVMPAEDLPAPKCLPRADMSQGPPELLDDKTPLCISSDSACISSSALLTPPDLSRPASVKAPAASSLGTDSSPSTSAALSSSAPLQTILNALFLRRKQDYDASDRNTVEVTNTESENLCYPIGEKFGQMCKDEKGDENDRLYDPEEEHDLGMDMNGGKSNGVSANEFIVKQSPDASAIAVADVAYDPEDESIFEEVKTLTAAQLKFKTSPENTAVSRNDCSMLMEKKKMLEDLNKEIELQKRQLAEQEETLRQQRAAIGLSMARFSVSDALMSPPSKSSEIKRRSVRLGENTEDLPSMHSAPPNISNWSCPLDSIDPWQVTTNTSLVSESLEKERTSAQAMLSTSLEVSFLDDTEHAEVCYPLLRGIKDPQLKNGPYQKCIIETVKEEKDHTEDEAESNSYAALKNSAQMLNNILSPKSSPFEYFSSAPAMLHPAQASTAFLPENNTLSSQFPGITNYLGESQCPPIPSAYLEIRDFGSPLGTSQSVTFQPEKGLEIDQMGPPDICPPRQYENPQKDVNRSIMGQRDHDKYEPKDQKSSQEMTQMDLQSGAATVCQEPLQPFDREKHSYQLNFKKLKSKVDYSRPSGHPSHSIGPDQNNFDSMDLHSPDPRTFSHSNYFASHGPQTPLLGTPEDVNDIQDRNCKNYFQHEMENHKVCESSHMNGEDIFSGHPHNQHDWGRRPLGEHLTPSNRFEDPRMRVPFLQSQEMPSPQCSGPFRDYRGLHSSRFQVIRCPSPSQFRGPQPIREQPRFHYHGQGYPLNGRPVRRPGPLLPTPPEYLIQRHSHIGQSSAFHYQGHWNHYPDMERRGTCSNSELWSGELRLSRTREFQSGHHQRKSLQYSEEWRRERGGIHSKAWASDLTMDRPGGPERYQRRGRTEDDDARRVKGVKRTEEGERNRERNRKDFDENEQPKQKSVVKTGIVNVADCEQDSRDRRRDQSRTRDRDHGKDFGSERVREHGQDKKRD